MAEVWFANNGWFMVRTQPPTTILGMVTPVMAGVLRRFIPRLACFGFMVIARLGRGGVSDYTGYEIETLTSDEGNPFYNLALYRACEVKEADGDTMPASRLDKEQREFMARLPKTCAWVGIFWRDTQKFTMHEFIEKGSYKRP